MYIYLICVRVLIMVKSSDRKRNKQYLKRIDTIRQHQ